MMALSGADVVLPDRVVRGGSIVIDNRFAFPNVVLSSMQAHGVTGLAGVPTFWIQLMQRHSPFAQRACPSVSRRQRFR